MADHGCRREPELLEALCAGRWMEAPDEDLRAHVTGCASCSEVAVVAAALLEDRRSGVHDAALPGSGLVWWRMQLRARREEERATARTVAIVHGLAIAAAVGVALAIVLATRLANPNGWLKEIVETLRSGTLVTASVGIFLSWGGPLLLALVAWLVLAPVAVWLAVTEE